MSSWSGTCSSSSRSRRIGRPNRTRSGRCRRRGRSTRNSSMPRPHRSLCPHRNRAGRRMRSGSRSTSTGWPFPCTAGIRRRRRRRRRRRPHPRPRRVSFPSGTGNHSRRRSPGCRRRKTRRHRPARCRRWSHRRKRPRHTTVPGHTPRRTRLRCRKTRVPFRPSSSRRRSSRGNWHHPAQGSFSPAQRHRCQSGSRGHGPSQALPGNQSGYNPAGR